jgi:hypothetical protein
MRMPGCGVELCSFRTPEHKGKISRDCLGAQDLRLVLQPGPWHHRELPRAPLLSAVMISASDLCLPIVVSSENVI